MTGNGSWRGRPARRGIDIAAHALKERGGPRIRLRVLDDRGDDRRSTRLVRRAARSSGTDAVVFAGPPRAVARAESSLADRAIPAFLCYGDLEGARRLTRHVFQMGPGFDREARLLVGDALRARRGGRLGALTEDSVMGRVGRAALVDALDRQGARLASRIFDPSRLRRIGRHLEKLRAARVRRLFVEASPGELGRISSALARMDWSPRIFGFDLTLSPPYRGPAPPSDAAAADWVTRAAGVRGSDRFTRFQKASVDVTGARPRWWEFRSYLATLLVARAERGAGDPVRRLERMRAKRVAGVDVTLSRRDHVVPNARDVRLWKLKELR
jgi:ABC-type branched-subunit amino acid transport system substrate-binding protein